MGSKKRLSRELSPEEISEIARVSDESLPEAPTIHRRPLPSNRVAGGVEHLAGAEEEEWEGPRGKGPERTDPPRGQKPSKGA